MRLRRLAELGRIEWLVLAQLVPIAAAAKVALYRVPVQNVVRALERLASRPRVGLPLFAGALDEHRLYPIADWATRVPGGKTPCLIRSLLLHLMLVHRGEPSVIALGVMKDGAKLRSHAWVTLRGLPLGESDAALAAFTPIAHFGLQ